METAERIAAVLRAGTAQASLEPQLPITARSIVNVQAGSHRTIIQKMLGEDETTGISAITGVDLGNAIELLYHLRFLKQIVTFRFQVDRDNPRVQTITDLLPGANFHEREVFDLFGVVFDGHPNLQRLILSDNWPKDLFPLRKGATMIEPRQELDEQAKIDRQEQTTTDGGEERLLNITVGPQHPALLEPEKFSIAVEGEIVKTVTPRIGYVHRGIEKATEHRTYLQNIFLVERICGICNSCHATCFCQAVEQILGITIPPKADFLRTIVLELNRLHSHMLLLGHAGFELGYESLFQYMWRDREPIMDMMEWLTGNRVIASFVTIGGVRRDLSDELRPKMHEALDTLKKKMDFYTRLFDSDPSIKMRTKHVGILSKQDALKLCVVGPVARGSGIAMDVRKDEPYAAYGSIPFRVPTRTEGDSLGRLQIRVEEICESIDIIKYALDNLPSGPFRVKVPRIVPVGEAVSRVEAPRGELMYYVKSNGTAFPERVKMRTPTFSNLLSFVTIAEGGNYADVPASFVSLDPCFSCTDR